MRLENAVIKSVDEAFIVHSEEGRIDRTVDRKYYALSLCLSGQITYTQNGKEYVSTPATAVTVWAIIQLTTMCVFLGSGSMPAGVGGTG